MSETRPTKLFELHQRVFRESRYVYPVISRRSRGLSIGVNLNPDKACNFDCVYCSVDRTIESKVREVDIGVLDVELGLMIGWATGGDIFAMPPFDRTPAPLRRFNDVAFSGDGEPTSSPHFPAACELVVRWLDKMVPRSSVKIVVITNATLLHRPEVAKALEFLDRHNGEIWAKLDAGTESYFRKIERTHVPFARVLENILKAGRRRPIVIQSLFLKLDGVGPDEGEIDAYIERLRELTRDGCRIKLVQVYTVARPPAEVVVTPLENGAIDRIVDRVRAIGLEAEGFYGLG